jgi:NAD(P)H-dependent FMN reductase
VPPEPPDRVLIVLGSVTPPGRLRGALEQAATRGRQRGPGIGLVDLADRRLGFADGRPPAELEDDTAELLDAVASASAVVLATPVYRGSMTGALKNLLDLTPVPALEGKPVGIVAMGGSDHHFLGAERHLRDVLAFFGALVLPYPVYLKSADFTDGQASESAAARLDELIDGAAALATLHADAEPSLGPPNPLAVPAAARS